MDLAATMDGGFEPRDSARRAKREAAYRAAMRHSRIVRLLKWLIPLGAGLTSLFIVVVMIFDPFRPLPPGVSLKSIGLDGARIVMEAPRLQGYRRDSRPYEVTARAAAQDVRSPHVVELEDLDARLSIGVDGSARVQSPFGLLDSQKETLDLRGAVRVTTDTGYDVRLKSAMVHFKTGHVRTSEPVSVTMNDGVIDADSMEIVENGAQIVFSGRVRTVLTPREAHARGDGRTAQAEENRP